MPRAVQNFTAWFGFGAKVFGDWFEKYDGAPLGRGPWSAPSTIARSKMRVGDEHSASSASRSWQFRRWRWLVIVVERVGFAPRFRGDRERVAVLVEPTDQGGDARGAGEHVALQRMGSDLTRARIALALASWTAADRATFAKLFDRFTDEMTRESDARARRASTSRLRA